MTFQRIESHTFSGARSYFTNFDSTIVTHQKDLVTFKKNIERSLKILLLTKSSVVTGASVMISSMFVYEFFRENPILLTDSMVIPALRYDKLSVGQYAERLDKVDITTQKEIAHFYDSRVPKVVSWKLKENANWFKYAFLKGFQEQNSVIRRNLTTLSQEQIHQLIIKIRREVFLNKGAIEDAIQDFPPNEVTVLRNYRELMYHMSGARVVNCESNLPQENYIDYSLADMKNRKTILSELQVFWKVFLELFFETFNKPKIPIEVLDLLSFEDIQKIRLPLLENNFIENYDRLVKKAVQTVRIDAPHKLLFNIEELFEIKNKLNFYFKSVFEDEIQHLEKVRNIHSVSQKLKNNFNVGLGISPISQFAGVTENTPSSISYLFNATQGFNNYRSINQYKASLQIKQKQLNEMIQEVNTDDKKSLSEVVCLLTESVNEKLII